MRGVTLIMDYFFNDYSLFQLTRLMRGVTSKDINTDRIKAISTHTPHARRDYGVGTCKSQLADFNSHASCEA